MLDRIFSGSTPAELKAFYRDTAVKAYGLNL